MKKVLATFLAILIGASAFSMLTFSATTLVGDVDMNGIVNSQDLAALRKQLLGLEDFTANSDVNQDNAVNIADLVKLKKILADAYVVLSVPVATVANGVVSDTADAVVTFTGSDDAVVNSSYSDGVYKLDLKPGATGTLTVAQDGYDTVEKSVTATANTLLDKIELQRSILFSSNEMDLSKQGYNTIKPMAKYTTAAYTGMSQRTQYRVSAVFSDKADIKKRQGFTFGMGTTSFSITINYEASYGWGIQSINDIGNWAWWYKLSDATDVSDIINKYIKTGIELAVERNGSHFDVYVDGTLVKKIDIDAKYQNDVGNVKIVTYDNLTDSITISQPVLPVTVTVPVNATAGGVTTEAPNAAVSFVTANGATINATNTGNMYALNIIPGTTGTLTVSQDGYDTYTGSLTITESTALGAVNLQNTTLIKNNGFNLSQQGSNLVTPAQTSCNAVYSGLSDKTQYTVSAVISDKADTKKRQGIACVMGDTNFTPTINNDTSNGWGIQTMSGVVNWKWLIHLNDRTDIIEKYQTTGIEFKVVRNGADFKVYIDNEYMCGWTFDSSYAIKYGDVKLVTYDNIADTILISKPVLPSAVDLTVPVQATANSVTTDATDASVVFTANDGTVYNGVYTPSGYSLNVVPGVFGTLKISKNGYDTVTKTVWVTESAVLEAVNLQRTILTENNGFNVSAQGSNTVSPTQSSCNAVYASLYDKTKYTVSATFSDKLDSKKRQGFTFGLGTDKTGVTINYDSNKGWGLQAMSGVSNWKWWYVFEEGSAIITKYQSEGIELTVTRNGAHYDVYIDGTLIVNFDVSADNAALCGQVKLVTYDGITDAIAIKEPVLPSTATLSVPVTVTANSIKSDTQNASVVFTSANGVVYNAVYADGIYTLAATAGTAGVLTISQQGYDTVSQSIVINEDTLTDSVDLQKTILISNINFDISNQGSGVIVPTQPACSAVFAGLSDKIQYSVSATFSDVLDTKKRQGFTFGLGNTSFAVTINYDTNFGWGIQAMGGLYNWKCLYNLTDRTDIIEKYQSTGIELTVTRVGEYYDVMIDGELLFAINLLAEYSDQTGIVRVVTYDGINDPIIIKEPVI